MDMVEKPLFITEKFRTVTVYTNGNLKKINLTTGAVTSLANGPYAGYGALYGTRIYLIGAYGGPGGSRGFINDRYYDISNNTWTSFTSSGVNTVGSRMGMTGQIIGTKLYAFGGNANGSDGTELFVLNLSNHTWSVEHDGSGTAPDNKSYAGSFVYNSKFYIFGGRVSGYGTNDIWEYNPSTSSWSEIFSSTNSSTHPVDKELYVNFITENYT